MRQSPPQCLWGVDGCRGGWVVAESAPGTKLPRFDVVRDFASIVDRCERGLAAVDVPIGFAERGLRCCDQEARQRLGRRHVTVFSPPARSALDGKTHAEASRLNARACGKRISIQTFALFPKLREVDAAMTSRLQSRIVECHPELTFAELAGRADGLPQPKKTREGRTERIRLLQRFIRIDEARLRDERKRLGGSKVLELDDLVDALACLATAIRIRNGAAKRFPSIDEVDATGITMRITA